MYYLNMINICVFEDTLYKNLLPLTFNKPSYDLLIGIDTPLDKIKRYFSHANITLHCRNYLKPLLKKEHTQLAINKINTGAPGLFINGRVIMNKKVFTAINKFKEKQNHLLTYQGHVIAIYVSDELLSYMSKTLETIPTAQNLIQYLRNKCVSKELKECDLINSPVDLIYLNSNTINEDFKYKNTPGIIKGNLKPFANIYNEDNVFIDKESIVEDNVVINAEQGPVYIENNVIIEAGSRLEGPLFIGANSQIKGARLSKSSIGQYCKIGGEISNSVINSFTNKGHYGFMGHSYIGSWVNLGAGTTTSNMKNTYGTISVSVNGEIIDSEKQFLGSILPDHCKCGIGTHLNCGSIIGFGSNLFGTEIHSKIIPNFSWGESGKYETLQIDKFTEIIKRVKKRRNKSLLKVEKELYDYLYEEDQLIMTPPIQKTKNKEVEIKKNETKLSKS